MAEAVRVKIIPVIDGLRGSNLSGAYSLGPALYEAIGRIAPAPTGDMPMIRTLFREAEWWEVNDLCEAFVRQSRFPEATVTAIEALFAAENLPYAMTEDGIVWRFSAPASEVLRHCDCSSTTRRFARPPQQWQKALAHLSERPPDTENCIKTRSEPSRAQPASCRPVRPKLSPVSSRRLANKSACIPRSWD
jgi:hypothetical protein